MQHRLSYYQHSIRFLQITIRQFSSTNTQKPIVNNLSEDVKAKWYKNGVNRPLLSNTNNFKNRNIFLM